MSQGEGTSPLAAARSLWTQGRPAEARRHIESSLQENPTGSVLAQSLMGAGIICREIGDPVTALDYLQRLVAGWQDYPEMRGVLEGAAYYNMGLCHRQRREYQEAIVCYRLAIESFRAEGMQDYERQAWQNLAWVSCMTGDTSTADTALRQAHHLCESEDAQHKQWLGRAFLAYTEQHYARATHYCSDLMAAKPSDAIQAHAMWITGLVALAVGSIAEALHVVNQGITYALQVGDYRIMRDLSELRSECLVKQGAV